MIVINVKNMFTKFYFSVNIKFNIQNILFISLEEEYTSDIAVCLPAAFRVCTSYVCNVCVERGVVFSQRSQKTRIIYLYKGDKTMIRLFKRIIDLTFFFYRLKDFYAHNNEKKVK